MALSTFTLLCNDDHIHVFFFPILLRNKWHTSLHKFKVNGMMVWFTSFVKWGSATVQYNKKIHNTINTIKRKGKGKKILSPCDRICSLKNCPRCHTAVFTAVTRLDLTSLVIILWAEVWTFWPPSSNSSSPYPPSLVTARLVSFYAFLSCFVSFHMEVGLHSICLWFILLSMMPARSIMFLHMVGFLHFLWLNIIPL